MTLDRSNPWRLWIKEMKMSRLKQLMGSFLFFFKGGGEKALNFSLKAKATTLMESMLLLKHRAHKTLGQGINN